MEPPPSSQARVKGAVRQTAPREVGPGAGPWPVAWRGLAILGLLAAFLLAASLALTQSPYPDPDSRPSGLAALSYPLEKNAPRRLPVVGADIRGLHVHPDGQLLWVVGDHGLILHSRDGGLCWEPQTFPGGPPIPEEAIGRCRPRLWPSWPTLVPEAAAAAKPESARQASSQQNPVQTNVAIPAPAITDVKIAEKSPPPGPAVEQYVPPTPAPPARQRPPPDQEPDAERRPGPPDLLAVHFIDARQGWIVGTWGTILATSDGGATWQEQEATTRAGRYAVQFVDARRGWTTGDAWSSLLATSDGGATWQDARGDWEDRLQAVHFVDLRRGWVAGTRGLILATGDSGATWQEQNTGTAEDLRAVHFADPEHGWAVGDSGVIRATSDGGATWLVQDGSTDEALAAVHFVDAQHGWVAGSGGTVLATSDGGTTWQKQFSGTTAGLGSVRFVDRRRGWAAGSGGTILASRDGGRTWLRQSAGRPSQAGETAGLPYRRYPAPWLPAVTALLVLAGLLVLRPPKPRLLKRSIADLLATDRPLRPEDLKAGQDALGVGGLAEDLSHFLRNPSTVAPLTIAITGEWGSGKSSLMSLLAADLEHYRFRPVWFNAWHHQKGEQLLASLFAHIKEQAVPGWLQRGGIEFRIRLAVFRAQRSWPLYALLLAVFLASAAYSREQVAAVLRGLLALVVHPEAWWQHYAGWLGAALAQPLAAMAGVSVQDWLGFFAALFGLGAPLATVLKASKGFGLNPARLVTVNPDRPGGQGLDPGARARFSQEFRDVTRGLGRRKMVIFIDDLDRCSKDNLIEILESVNFLATSGDCFIVLGMSPEWVESCVALKYEELAAELAAEKPTDGDPKEHKRRFARNYLEKMINIEVPIPKLDQRGATLLLQGSKGTAGAPAAAWAAALKAPVALALVVAYGLWYGLSIPRPPVVTGPDQLVSWPVDATHLRRLSPEGSLLGLASPEQPPATEAGQEPNGGTVRLEVALQARKEALAKGIVVGSFGSGEGTAQLVLRQAPEQGGTGEKPGAAGTPVTPTPPSPGREAFGQEQPAGPLLAAPDPDASAGARWLIWLLGGVGLAATVRAFFLRQRDFTEDSPAFLKALSIWQPWVLVKQDTPRALKRYLNRVRFIALRLRGRFPEAGTVALAAIYYLSSDWLLGPEAYQQVLDGDLAPLLATSRALEPGQGQVEQLAAVLAASPAAHAQWAAEAADEQEWQEAAWPPAPDHRQEVLRVLAASPLGQPPASEGPTGAAAAAVAS
ncbi:MAG: YCF48-related protein [Thermodesulfobacteriota bacterium]